MADPKENEEVDETEAEEEEGAGASEGEAEGEEGTEGEGESEGEEEVAAGEAGGEAEGEGTAQASQSRRDKRIAALTKANAEEKEKRIRAETLAEERARQPHTAVNTEEARRREEEKLALMTDSERKDYQRDKDLADMKQTALLTQLQTADAVDQMGYQARAAADPVWAKHAQEVEKRLYAERQRGSNYPRETILAVIVGEHALKARPTASAKKAAADRVNGAGGRTIPGKSNPTLNKTQRGKETFEELEARIGDVSFPDDMRF